MKVKSIENNSVFSYYKRFYISQSTAFITPILYIFINDRFAMLPAEILRISSIYWALSIVLQLPFGVIADRWGVKRNLYCCLALQATSCISLIFFHNSIGYHFYLICIYLAMSLNSSASAILIRKHFKDSESSEFKSFFFHLQNSFYLTTTILLLIGACSYEYNIYMPFYLQTVNFCVAAYYLNKIPEESISLAKNRQNIFRCARSDISKSLGFIAHDKYYLLILVCLIFFGLGVSINQKSIQFQLYELFSSQKVIMIGVVMAVGNLFSSIGAKFFYSKICSKYSSSNEIIILSILLILSYLLMSVGFIPFVILGFMVLNLFKGCYRPLLSAEFVSRYPFKKSINTNSSILFAVVVLVSAILQFSFAYSYSDVKYGNLIFALFSFIIIALTYILWKMSSSWCIKGEVNILSGKRGDLVGDQGRLLYVQVYPNGSSNQDLKSISVMAKHAHYPSTDMRIVNLNNGTKGIETQFLGETHLSDISDPDLQFLFCERIINTERPCFLNHRLAKILPEEYIFPPPLLDLLNSDAFLSQKCLIHGDLHPNNVMIHDDEPFVIDWDLCGTGPYWYDLLSLLSHPYLSFHTDKSFQLFLQNSNQLDLKDLKLIFIAFCNFKKIQLSNLSVYNSKFKQLATLYGEKSYTFQDS